VAGTERRGPRVADVLAMLVCAVLASAYLTPHVLDADEAVFAAIGGRMRALGLPAYAGGWDHKPPGVFWVYEALVSPWSAHGLLWVHAASAACWVATAYVVGATARRVLGATAFAPAVVAYALLRSFGETKAGAANTEAFLSPFLATGLALLALPTERAVRNALLGGAALGVAVVLKPPVAVYGPALVAAAFLVHGGRRAWTTAWAGAAGAAAVLAPVALHMLLAGTFEEGWRLNVEANRVYMEHGPRHGFGEIAAGLAHEAAIAPAPWILAAVGGAAACRTPRGRRVAAAFAALLAAGLFAVGLGGLLFRHYWLMVHPVLAVAAASGVAALVPRLPPATPRAWAGLAATAVVVAVAWIPAQWTDKRRLLHSHLFTNGAELPYETTQFAATADAVRRLSAPDDAIFVWGANPEIYLLAERVPASRQVSCGLLSGWLRPDVRAGLAPPDPDVFPGAWDALFEDLAAHPPRVVVDTSGGGYRDWQRFPVSLFPRLASWLEEGYDRAGAAGGCSLYLRRAR
jgi:4-amino-4-deoxy-L-arabinose transferase-like glycosyltransferase